MIHRAAPSLLAQQDAEEWLEGLSRGTLPAAGRCRHVSGLGHRAAQL